MEITTFFCWQNSEQFLFFLFTAVIINYLVVFIASQLYNLVWKWTLKFNPTGQTRPISKLCWAISCPLLDISEDGHSIAFLGSLIQCLTTLALSLFSIYPIRIFPVALCICWLSSFWHAFLRSGWLCLSLQIFADSSKICPQSSSGWTDSALSLYLSIQPLLTLVSCCWTHFSTSVSFLYWESSSWTQWICTIPQSVPVCGITPSRLRTLHLPLLSFMRFLPEVPGEEGEGRSVWIRRSLLQLPTGYKLVQRFLCITSPPGNMLTPAAAVREGPQ